MKTWRVRVEEMRVAHVTVEAHTKHDAMARAVSADNPIPDEWFDPPLAPEAVDARQVITDG